MKVEQDKPKFNPIIITLEDAKDVQFIRLLCLDVLDMTIATSSTNIARTSELLSRIDSFKEGTDGNT